MFQNWQARDEDTVENPFLNAPNRLRAYSLQKEPNVINVRNTDWRNLLKGCFISLIIVQK